MKSKVKKAVVNVVPYGIIEKRRKKQRELEQEQKRLERERKKEELARKKEELARKKEEAQRKKEEKERQKAEKERIKQEEKKEKFLHGKTSRQWGKYYAEYHEKEPLEENWILYESSAGVGMVCNPYAIFKAFQKMPEFHSYTHIWVIKDEEEMALLREEYQECKNVIFIHYCSKAYGYFLAKAKYLINNTSFPFAFSKKKGQIFLNTWHSITVKTLGYDLPDGNRLTKNMIRNLLMSDYVISPNEFTTKIFEESFRMADIYKGMYIQEGYPRNDLVVHTDPEEVYRKLEMRGTKIERNKKIILYAPTWTGNSVGNPLIDMRKYTDLYEYLSEHINMDEYQILIKPHQIVYKKLSDEIRQSGRYISYAIDANELLSVVDILITDYSSIFFDYLVADKPILFYIPDYKSYESMRGLYFRLQELPGICAYDLPTLSDGINNIESYRYCERRNEVKKWACRYEDGNVSEKIINTIFFKRSENYRLLQAAKTNKKKILMYIGGFHMDGVTSAALSLLKMLDYQKFDVSLFVSNLGSDVQNSNFDKLPKEIRVIMRCNPPSLTEEQKEVYDITMRDGLDVAEEYKPLQDYLMKREYERCFGDSSFDYVIDFSGYGPYFTCLTAKQCPGAKKIIWQHSDMKKDYENEEKRAMNKAKSTVKSLLSVYCNYDKIVSASKPICEVNRKNFATEEDFSKFTYCPNMVDAKRIEKLISSAGICEINERTYARCVNNQKNNGVQEAVLIPLDEPGEKSVKFVTMGRCMPEKNHSNLIRALKRLKEEGVSCKLYIVGDGHMREELEELAEELGIGRDVIITGMLDNPFAVLKECDCFVFPSLYEAQGLAVLEARMVGLPIVVSNYPAVSSVMLDDKQYIMKGMDADACYDGMKAFLDGKVPDDYYFDIHEYNQKAYQKFVDLLETE